MVSLLKGTSSSTVRGWGLNSSNARMHWSSTGRPSSGRSAMRRLRDWKVDWTLQ